MMDAVATIIKYKKKTLSVVVIVVLLVLGGQFISSTVSALGPQGCSDEQPYNCAMSRRRFDQLVASWCGAAKQDKQAECKMWLYTQVHTSPRNIRRYANFTIPSYCELGYSASDEQKKNIPDACYIMPIRAGNFYKGLRSIIEECGLEDQQDQVCVSRMKQQLLHDQNPKWADAPDTSKSTTSDGAFNTKDDASRSAFINRLTVYIKWFTVGIGVLAVFGLVISGIQYAAAQENPQSVAAAKSRINNIIIGILIYLVMFALLQWLVPGGVF